MARLGLPYEAEAPGDVKLVEPFQVFVSQDGKIYRFILNNLTFRTQVKVVKVDAETGKPILLAGATFKIRDLATGKWVKQHVDYPTPTDISEFMTSADGMLVLPEPLRSGEYELFEVAAPRGYLLSDKPVKFTVHSSNGQEMVTVTMENKPVMGKVKVEKTGNMLTGAKEIETIFGKQYLPIFELGFLAGAEFDVIAAEDIVTPDGTVRAKKGDVVDQIVTGEGGKATSKELYLGEYELIETKAPPNYVLDPTPHPVTLAYEDQTVAVVTSQIGLNNVRQAVEISLTKAMETPASAPENFNAFADVVFGLFASEDFGSIIPKDTLVGIIALDETGRGVHDGDLPFGKYYVQELQTNPHYQLNETKYPVDATYAGQDKAVAAIQVNGGSAIPNKLKPGKLVVEKQGEVFVGATKTKDGYTPLFELRGLQGAAFNIIDSPGAYAPGLPRQANGGCEWWMFWSPFAVFSVHFFALIRIVKRTGYVVFDDVLAKGGGSAYEVMTA